ncbi:MAG: hypothetical protein HQM10_08155 [Candidatus Riflebacteria bacterium]|nr:hypothetical protein [Candidatus Riflebacteria bacterium]
MMSCFSFRRGMAIPFVIAIALILGILLATHSFVSRSYFTQIDHLNQAQIHFSIACSAQAKILASLYEKPWEEREFKTAPVSLFGQKILGGEYDSFVMNSPGKFFQLDIYIRTRAANKTQCYFWRIQYNDDIFDLSNRCYTIFFTPVKPSDFPSGGSGTISSNIDDLLDERIINKPPSDEKVEKIFKNPDLPNLVNAFPARAPGSTPLPDVSGVGSYSIPTLGIPQAKQNSPKPPATTDPDEIIKGPKGPVEILVEGTAKRVAFKDGEVTFKPKPRITGRYNIAKIIVNLYDPNGKQIFFKNPENGKNYPLLFWNRKDGKYYYPAYFKGIEDPDSLKLEGGAYSGNSKTYSFQILKGQTLRLSLDTSDPEAHLIAESDAFYP